MDWQFQEKSMNSRNYNGRREFNVTAFFFFRPSEIFGFFFFFPQVSWMDVPGGEWVLDKVGEKFLLRAMNSVGEYYFNSRDAAENAAEALGMEEITAVLDGTMDKNHCSCRGGIGQMRCQHRFTFNDVRSCERPG